MQSFNRPTDRELIQHRSNTSSQFDLKPFPSEIRNAMKIGHAQSGGNVTSEIRRLEERTNVHENLQTRTVINNNNLCSLGEDAAKDALLLNANTFYDPDLSQQIQALEMEKNRIQERVTTVVYLFGLPPEDRSDAKKFKFYLYILPDCQHCPGVKRLLDNCHSLRSCTYIFDASFKKTNPRWLKEVPTLYKRDTNEIFTGNQILTFIQTVITREQQSDNKTAQLQEIDRRIQALISSSSNFIPDSVNGGDDFYAYNKNRFEDEFLDYLDDDKPNSMNYSNITRELPRLKDSELPVRETTEQQILFRR